MFPGERQDASVFYRRLDELSEFHRERRPTEQAMDPELLDELRLLQGSFRPEFATQQERLRRKPSLHANFIEGFPQEHRLEEKTREQGVGLLLLLRVPNGQPSVFFGKVQSGTPGIKNCKRPQVFENFDQNS